MLCRELALSIFLCTFKVEGKSWQQTGRPHRGCSWLPQEGAAASLTLLTELVILVAGSILWEWICKVTTNLWTSESLFLPWGLFFDPSPLNPHHPRLIASPLGKILNIHYRSNVCVVPWTGVFTSWMGTSLGYWPSLQLTSLFYFFFQCFPAADCSRNINTQSWPKPINGFPWYWTCNPLP